MENVSRTFNLMDNFYANMKESLEIIIYAVMAANIFIIKNPQLWPCSAIFLP